MISFKTCIDKWPSGQVWLHYCSFLSTGYYCPTGQSSSSPFPCGEGYYCEEGSANETACVSGTYQDDTGQSSCKLCNGGTKMTDFFLTQGNVMVTWSVMMNENRQICIFSLYWIKIENLKLFWTTAQETCLWQKNHLYYKHYLCKTIIIIIIISHHFLGYYCDVADAPISDYTVYPCPVGHYCMNGTEFSTQFPCPAGTYNPSERLEREGQCLDCPPGKFCDTPGQDNWMGDCTAGYWCIGASSSATPDDDVTGVECPAGKYCIEGAWFYEWACVTFPGWNTVMNKLSRVKLGYRL